MYNCIPFRLMILYVQLKIAPSKIDFPSSKIVYTTKMLSICRPDFEDDRFLK